MSKSEPQGCLAALFSLLGIQLSSSESRKALPFKLRDDFLSNAELSFYRVLSQVVEGDKVIFTKVNLADLFFVVRPKENPGYRNKIDRKHVDFLICSARDARPCYAVELDDSSHARPDRVERDAFVDAVFQTAGLPLVRVKAARNYDLRELQRLLVSAARQPDAPNALPAKSTEVSGEPPRCPKCGVFMTERTSKRGANRGAAFWGCVNYPRCREVKKIT